MSTIPASLSISRPVLAAPEVAVAPSLAALPLDASGVLKLAAQSLFDTLASTALGMLVVDREHRIVWISEGYNSSCRRWNALKPISSAAASKRSCRTP